MPCVYVFVDIPDLSLACPAFAPPELEMMGVWCFRIQRAACELKRKTCAFLCPLPHPPGVFFSFFFFKESGLRDQQSATKHLGPQEIFLPFPERKTVIRLDQYFITSVHFKKSSPKPSQDMSLRHSVVGLARTHKL